MEINRRHFIALLAGGAAGIHITPLPWKLMDDIAIWTQNWSWVPVPPKGQFTHVNSICHLCPGGCGIEVRKVDNRAVKIEGRVDYPVNPGGICPVGMGGLQLLYNESIRYTGPMKRVGPRGSGKFIDITWDEAVELLAGRISGLRDKGTPEALVAVDGNPIQATMSVMIERLLRAVGSPNYMRLASAEETYRMTNLLMQGTEGPMAYDLENADYVLSFGSGLLEGWGAPGRVINAWSLWRGGDAKKKAKIVQIESRASNTASKSDQWIAPKPGTEAALALGLAHVIIKNRLYDAEFINAHCFGFHDWSSSTGENHMGFKTMVLEKYSPSHVAEITGLSVKDIISLAKEFATAKAPIAICGKGKGALPGSLYEFMAVQSLNALVGNINRPGGILVHDPLRLSPLPQIEEDAIAIDGLRKPRIDRAGSMQYPFTQSLINNLTDAILESPNSPVNTLLVFSANPAHTLPDGGRFKRALKRIPFIVSFSPFRDETSYMADLILPDHLYLEKTDDIVWPAGLQYPLYGLSKPVLDPIYSTRHSGEVIIQLAKAIGGSVASAFPWHNYEAVLKERVKGLFHAGAGSLAYDGAVPVWQMQKAGKLPRFEYESFDEMWKKIRSDGLWYKPTHVYKNWEALFNTTTGKFEFYSTRLKQAVQDYAGGSSEAWALKRMEIAARGDVVFMPHYEEATAEVDPAEYPLLMVPYEIINLASGWVPNPPHLNKTIFDDQLRKDESFAEINPTTAQAYGLKEGDRVIITSPAGKVQVRVNLFEGAMPGVVFLPLGFGHTAYDEFSQGKGVNPNDMIPRGKDPLSGHPVWWKTPVQLTKAFDS